MIDQYLPKVSEPGRRWIRFVALLLICGVLSWILYKLRTVFTPLLAALAIAYIVSPVVTAIERRAKVRRLTVVIIVFVLLGALLIGGGLYVGASTVAQIQQLGDRLPAYQARAEAWLNARAPAPVDPTNPTATMPASIPARMPLPDAGEWWRFVSPVLKAHGAAIASSTVGYAIQVLSSAAALVSLLVLLPLYTFFFLWHFDDIVMLSRDHLPASYRPGVVHIVRTIDAAMASFFRGRLIVCLIVGVLTAIGWTIVGVPYSLPLGLLIGLLNLVPFLSLTGLPPVLFLTFLAARDDGTSWALPVTLAMGVYIAVQALESFVLSPYVMGRSAGLHPVTIVVALLIGAELGGLLGMLLAIPLASTFKTLAAELILPEIRRLAKAPAAPPGTGP